MKTSLKPIKMKINTTIKYYSWGLYFGIAGKAATCNGGISYGH